MNIEVHYGELPPNYDKIVAAIPAAGESREAIFCYGSKVYAPFIDKGVGPELVAHEFVHAKRQGDDPEGWWDRYLVDVQFRLDEELAAHKAEYAYIAAHNSRPYRRHMMTVIAKRLSGPIYGYCISFETAKRAIIGEVDRVLVRQAKRAA